MSERWLTDKDLDLLGLRFPTHFGMPETSVLVQQVLSELRERRAADLSGYTEEEAETMAIAAEIRSGAWRTTKGDAGE